MSEWWTYSLRDFLLFSPRTYQRLLERYNAEVWPAQLLGLFACLALVLVLARWPQGATRFVALVLAAGWGWVSWAFFWTRYASVNWAAAYFALAFAVGAIVLLWIAASVRDGSRGERAVGRVSLSPPHRRARAAGFLMLAVALGYPAIPVVEGYGAGAAETFGFMPDPTVLATLGFLVLVRVPQGWAVLTIAVAWALVTAATGWVLQSSRWWVVPAAAVIAVAALVFARERADRTDAAVR